MRLYAEYTSFGLQSLRPHLSNAQDQKRVEAWTARIASAPVFWILMLDLY